jgi:DNA-binding response OmpR family regulator
MPESTQQPFVLLVEDSDDDAFFFQRALRQSGFGGRFAHAPDGEAAVTALRAGRPDLVFLDLKIPRLTGFEVLAWIGTQNFEPPLDIAVLSGSEHPGDVSRAMGLGASAYYVKPILVQQLKTRLRAWHDRHADDSQSVVGPARPA